MAHMVWERVGKTAHHFTVVLDGCNLRIGVKQIEVPSKLDKIDRMAPIYVLDLGLIFLNTAIRDHIGDHSSPFHGSRRK